MTRLGINACTDSACFATGLKLLNLDLLLRVLQMLIYPYMVVEAVTLSATHKVTELELTCTVRSGTDSVRGGRRQSSFASLSYARCKRL